MGLSRFDDLISGNFKCALDYDFWPSEEANSKKVLIVLHGRGDTLEGFHWLPEGLTIESFNYLFLNAPDPYGVGFSWYPLAPNQGPGVVRSRAYLTELIDRLVNDVGVASTDIYLFGFSQGCLMSLDVALRYPKCLGGVVGVSGYVHFLEQYPRDLSPVIAHQKFLVTHGTEDDVLPIASTRASIERLRALGVNIDWREYLKAHSIDDVTELPAIREFLMHLLDVN